MTGRRYTEAAMVSQTRAMLELARSAVAATCAEGSDRRPLAELSQPGLLDRGVTVPPAP